MTALLASEQAFRLAKSRLHNIFPEIKSSHLAESLAASLGFNTHAAWIQHMKEAASDPEIRLLDPLVFERRIAALGYNIAWDGSVETEFIGFEDGQLAFATSSYELDDGKPPSMRDRAWQNLMIAGINAGIRQKVFGLRVDDNRWPGYVPDSRDGESSYVYHFHLDGLPASAFVHDIGYGELALHVVLQPTGKFMSALDSGFSSGEASAGGWLERRKGLWLQDSGGQGMFTCRKHLVDRIAGLSVTPAGYGPKGKFYM
jgi:hypothetical protein